MTDFVLTAMELFDQQERPFTPEENSARLANLISSYGVGTHSYNNSPEKRELDRQRAETTAKYESAEHNEVEVPLSCECRSFRYPHTLEAHDRLKPLRGSAASWFGERDWRTWEERASDTWEEW
jgi:hypothetical protein